MTPVWPQHGSPAAEAVASFVSDRIYGRPNAFSGYTALAVLDRERLVAGLVYCDFDREAGVIQISGAATTPRWLTRRVLFEMFSFPFDQLGCQAVVMRVDPADRRLRRILTAYGFDRYDIPRLRGRDKAEAIYVLGDDVWRSNGFHREHREHDAQVQQRT